MAKLEGQSIASSYEQLLHVDRDGGGNGTTLVDVKDGKNTTTFALKLATDKAEIDGALTIDQDSNVSALTVDTEATTAHGIFFNAPTITEGNVLLVDGANSLTTGRLAYFGSNSSDNSSRNLFEIQNINSSATGATALKITQNSTAPALVALGNIGIGTSSPEASLDVNTSITGNTGVNYGVIIRGSEVSGTNLEAGDGIGLKFEVPADTATSAVGASIEALKAVGTDSSHETKLLFKTSGSNETLNTTFTMFHNQNVAIEATKEFYLDGGSNTFISEVSSDTIQFTTGGSERVRIHSSGDVSIGDSTLPRLSAVSGVDNGLRIAHASSDGDVAYFEMEGKKSGADADVCIMSFNNADSDDTYKRLGEIRVSRVGADNSGQFSFRTDNAGTFGTRMTITSAGNVGIGTTSNNNSAKLGVAGDINIGNGQSSSIAYFENSGTDMYIEGNSSNLNIGSVGNTQFIRFTAGGGLQVPSGTVGIGNAGTDRSVRPAGYAVPKLAIEGTAFDGALTVIENQNDISGGLIAIGKSRGTSANANTIVQNGDVVGRLTFNPADGTDVRINGGEIRTVVNDSSPAENAIACDLLFMTNDSTSIDAATRFRLDANSRISLSNNDGGTQNTVFGHTAGDGNGSGIDAGSNYNVFIGHNVAGGGTLSDATENTAVGYSALANLTSGDANVAIGRSALINLNTGTDNVAVGIKALEAVTDSQYNVGVGRQAAFKITTGDKNISIGAGTLAIATTASSIIAIGHDAAYSVSASSTTSDGTVAIGDSALNALTTGAANTAIGYQALDAEDAGGNNVAVGYQSLTNQNNDTGGNTAVGKASGSAITSGYSNTLIGHSAGSTLQGGYQNTIIGMNADATSGKINATAVGYGTIAQADDSVTLGNDAVSAVYMASDSGAIVHTAGIQFPASQVANGGANTLDDYEEGTWTPAFVSGSGHAPSSITVTRAVYTKIGNVVTLEGNIGFDDSGGGGDAFTLSGVPFNFATNSFPTGVANFRFTAFSESTMIYALGNAGSGQLAFYYNDGNGDRAFVSYTNTDVGSNTLTFTITYIV